MDNAESEVEICSRIHSALGTLTLYHDVTHSVPADGLYFFYEDGELNGHDGGPRIVRVETIRGGPGDSGIACATTILGARMAVCSASSWAAQP